MPCKRRLVADCDCDIISVKLAFFAILNRTLEKEKDGIRNFSIFISYLIAIIIYRHLLFTEIFVLMKIPKLAFICVLKNLHLTNFMIYFS